MKTSERTLTRGGKLRVLITSPPFLEVLDDYIEEFHARGIEVVVRRPTQFFSEEEMTSLTRGVDGIICGDDEITNRVLCEAESLKVISKWGVGIDSIDVCAAARRGIRVCNSPGAFSDACADVAMGYLLMLARHLHTTHAATLRGRWQKPRGMLLRGRTAGIIGVGNIGKEIARRAVAFGMNVVGTDIRDIDREFLDETSMEMVSREELLRRSDAVFVSCDLNPGSWHLVDGSAMRRMKRSSYLINIARGPIVDNRALAEALRDGVIAGAALDVFEDEPLRCDSPLRLFDTCILGAHNAYHADHSVEYVHRNTLDSLFEHLCGDELVNVEEALGRKLDELEMSEGKAVNVF